MTIIESALYLHLPFIKNNYEEFLKEAHLKDLSHEEFLTELLNREAELRYSNGVQKRISNSKFPYTITFSDYKRSHFSTEVKTKIKEVETLEFIKNGENIILVGNPGTGKTALSIALGIKACFEGKSVLFISVPDLLLKLREAMSNNQITSFKKKFERYDLVILDELGYCTFDKERGEILFNLLSARSQNKSLIITSNLTLDKWDEVFKDKILTAAIIDRLAHKSHLIDMSGNSYRIKETIDWKSKKGNKENDN